jgi:putative membrane protein
MTRRHADTAWRTGVATAVLAAVLSASPLPLDATSGQSPTPQTPQDPAARPRPQEPTTPATRPRTPTDGAQTPRDPAQSSSGRAAALSGQDREFLQKAAAGGAAEVALATLAQQKGQAVKELARMIEQDHTTANAELKTIASSKNVAVEAKPMPEHQQLQKKLEGLDGAAFDKAYAQAMVKEHAKDIRLFERAAKSADAEIKAFAEKTLPTLREHHKRAQQLASGTGRTSE